MEYTFKCTLDKFQKNNVWAYHFIIPNSIVKELFKEGKRVVCTINKEISYQCGIISAGDLGYFININAAIRKQAKIAWHDEVSLTLRSDTSKYGLPVPEIFKELLQQDVEFNGVFHKLTKGKQRSLLHLVGTFKSEQKQLEKAMIIRDYLIQVNGKLDYKELNLAFKNSRYR
jgi:hypothetical protein